MALAKKGGKKGKHHESFKGKVTAVDSKTITVASKKAGTKVFYVSAKTKVSVDGAKGKSLSDIRTGMHAKVKLGKAAGTAAAITAKSHKGKKGKKSKTALRAAPFSMTLAA
jgi:hypothetical protein